MARSRGSPKILLGQNGNEEEVAWISSVPLGTGIKSTPIWSFVLFVHSNVMVRDTEPAPLALRRYWGKLCHKSSSPALLSCCGHVPYIPIDMKWIWEWNCRKKWENESKANQNFYRVGGRDWSRSSCWCWVGLFPPQRISRLHFCGKFCEDFELLLLTYAQVRFTILSRRGSPRIRTIRFSVINSSI